MLLVFQIFLFGHFTEQKTELFYLEKDGEWKLNTNLYDVLPKHNVGMISTEVLGMAFEPDQMYENPDGTPLTFNTDYFGNHRAVAPMVGPFESAEDAKKVLA